MRAPATIDDDGLADVEAAAPLRKEGHMENWALRKSQTARIVGTSDPYRLREILAEARSHVARQRPGATMATWQSVGPDNVPGRIGALAISRQDSRVLYAGSAAGGVYKSTDGGGRWHALWSQQESLAVGGLAVAPSTDDVVYVATGEWEDKSRPGLRGRRPVAASLPRRRPDLGRRRGECARHLQRNDQ